MEKLFSVPMGGLATGMAAALIAVIAIIAVLAYRNPILLKIGLRNIPRRRAQTVLVIVGLMLSTAIIGASLALGDTISTSIRTSALAGLGNIDIAIERPLFSAFADDFISPEQLAKVRRSTESDARIDGVMPQIRRQLPLATRLGTPDARTEARATVVGLDLGNQAGFGELSTIAGAPIRLAALGPNEAYLNENLAAKLDASAGDRMSLFTPQGQKELTVKAIIEDRGLAGSRPTADGLGSGDVALMPLETLQQALDRPGQVNRVELSIRGESRPKRQLSDEVTEALRVAFTDPDVAAALFATLKAPESRAALETYLERGEGLPGDTSSDLRQVLRELEADAPSDEFRSLLADNLLAATVVVALEQAGMLEVMAQTISQIAGLIVLSVEDIKTDLLDLADLIGSFFTTIFTILGSFSIMAGLLLIFLVFVMLAASRSTEMGIARAIGTKRRQLVMTFVFEGVAYALMASLGGVALGVLASLALVTVLAGLVPDDVDFTIRYAVQFRSLVVAFSAGTLITIGTVAFSAYRVSRLNISVAIRGLSEQFVPSDTAPAGSRLLRLGQALLGPIYLLARALRLGSSGFPWAPSALAGLGLLVPLVGWTIWIVWTGVTLWRLISPYVGQGWPVIGFGMAVGVAGSVQDSAAIFSIGASAFFVGISLFARLLLGRTGRREETVSRISFTLMGGLLLVFWSLPFHALDWLTGELKGDFEMFFLSGSFMVAAAVWLIMHNTEVVLWPLNATLGRMRGLRPVLRAALAYPMAAKFRTGLTLAMFALIVFTLMVLAIINEAFSNSILDDFNRITGGYEIRATISRDLPIDDIKTAIEQAPGLARGDFEVITASADLPAEARQIGPYADTEIDEQRFLRLSITAADEAFLTTNAFELAHFDDAFGTSSRDIWDRVAADPALAVASFNVLKIEGGDFDDRSGESFKVQGIEAGGEEKIEAFDIEVRPSRGAGDPVSRTVIGVIKADPFESSPGRIYTRTDIIPQRATRPVPMTVFRFRLREGAHAQDIAPALESAFFDHSMDAQVSEDEIRDEISVNRAFNRLFEGYMGLGLLVGVASLGVISFRAVVERRQAIGMLRAIGFRAGMIRMQFLIESSLIALLGIALGMALGSLISWNLLNDLNEDFGGLEFSIPWLTVAVIVAVAYAFSLLTTYWPARQAGSIYPAEALRYE